MICRTIYCEACAKAGRPRTGDLFGVYGSKNHKIWMYRLDHNVKDKGFTPHLITILKYNPDDEKAEIEILCGMHKCGIEFYRKKETDSEGEIGIYFNEPKIMSLNKTDLLVLMKVKDYGYKLI